MRTKDKIESIIKKFRVTAGAKIYRQTLADVLAAQKSSRKTISAETRPNIKYPNLPPQR